MTPVLKVKEHIHLMWIKCKTCFIHNVTSWAKQALTWFVNQGGTNCNRCTQRLVISRVQTY